MRVLLGLGFNGEFQKIRCALLLWGRYNMDPTIQGTVLGLPIFGNSHF